MTFDQLRARLLLITLGGSHLLDSLEELPCDLSEKVVERFSVGSEWFGVHHLGSEGRTILVIEAWVVYFETGSHLAHPLTKGPCSGFMVLSGEFGLASMGIRKPASFQTSGEKFVVSCLIYLLHLLFCNLHS